MNGWSIAGISVAVIGILVIILGAMLQSIDLSSPDFMSFATGGIILLAIGLCMITGLPAILQIAGIWLAAYIQLAGYRFCYQSDWFYSYYRTGFLGIF